MLKGCQREMIVLQTRDSSFFESAYFVLRRDRAPAAGCDMVAEANRIIGMGGDYLTRRRRIRGALPFLLGVLLGVGAFALVLLIIG